MVQLDKLQVLKKFAKSLVFRL